jgi:Ni/Co efflux regulator RcnB
MNFTKIALLATAGAALVMSPAYAKPHGDSHNDNGGWHQNRDDHNDRDRHDGDRHDGGRDWHKGYSDSGWTPPGLAKKPYGMPPGQAKKLHRYAVGQHLSRTYYVNRDYYVTDYNRYNLAPPPSGYQWVREGNDVYLTQTRTGLIAQVIADLLH